MQSKKTVYVPVSGSGKQVYHTDRECTHLSRSVVREISLDVLHEDSTECVRCERGHGGGGVRSREDRRLPECPVCGEEITNDVPSHLRNDCDGA
jgi:hypothetical protein